MKSKLLLMAQLHCWMPNVHTGFKIYLYMSNLWDIDRTDYFTNIQYISQYLIMSSSGFFFTQSFNAAQHPDEYPDIVLYIFEYDIRILLALFIFLLVELTRKFCLIQFNLSAFRPVINFINGYLQLPEQHYHQRKCIICRFGNVASVDKLQEWF